MAVIALPVVAKALMATPPVLVILRAGDDPLPFADRADPLEAVNCKASPTPVLVRASAEPEPVLVRLNKPFAEAEV